MLYWSRGGGRESCTYKYTEGENAGCGFNHLRGGYSFGTSFSFIFCFVSGVCSHALISTFGTVYLQNVGPFYFTFEPSEYLLHVFPWATYTGRESQQLEELSSCGMLYLFMWLPSHRYVPTSIGMQNKPIADRHHNSTGAFECG